MSVIKRIIWPIVFAVAFYVVGVFLFGVMAPDKVRPFSNLSLSRPAYGHLLKRVKEAETIKNTDVLILGSSHAYRGFDPRIFREHGVNMFNFGSSSQSPLQSEYLCKKYLEQMQPQVVIVETYPLLYSNDGIEANLDFISNSPIDQNLLRLTAKNADPRVLNQYLLRFTKKMAGIEREYQAINVGSDTYINGGFTEKHTDAKPSKKTWPDQPMEIIASQREALENIIEFCAQNGVEVLLVQAPVSSGYYSSLQGMEAFDTEMKKLAPYINYNERVPLVDSLHFYDNHHLNQAGVGIFNRAVIEDLNGLMQKREGDWE